MSIDDILNRLEAAEKDFVGREFLAPVVGPGQVMVRIAGVICRIRVIDGLPRGFKGWALLQALATSRARFIGRASLTQIADYLSLLPAVRLILIQLQGKHWLSLPAQTGDRRFRIEGLVSLELAEEGLERFETVFSRFDGRLFWYEQRDSGRDPAVAAYLREKLSDTDARGLPPEAKQLHKLGLTREERAAYRFLRAAAVEEQQDRTELRLTSLVGVLRQAHDTGRIYWTGVPELHDE